MTEKHDSIPSGNKITFNDPNHIPREKFLSQLA